MKRLVFALLVLCQSCLLKTDEKVDLKDFDFSTTDSSELFFKNIRQSDYKIEERTTAKMNLFTYRSFAEKELVPIYPRIIHNWRADQAYIWLELNHQSDSTLIGISKPDLPKLEIAFEASSKEEHFETVNTIFEALLDSSRIYLNGDEVLAIGSSQRADFRLIVNDYYRLVNLK